MTKKEISPEFKTGIGILVLAFANTTAAGAEWCSAGLTTIASNFPDTPYWVITLINNVPNLCAVFMTLLAGFLVNRTIGLKQMMLFGIGFHAVGGVLPVFLGNSSIYLVLLSRIVFGIGYGVMQGICVSMTFKLVTKESLRDHAMGWAVSAQYAMNMFAQIAVGYLVAIKWNYSFFIYAWSVIPFIIVLVFCPRFPIDKNDRSAIGGEASISNESIMESVKALPSTVWIFSVIAGLAMMASITVLGFNLAPIICVKMGMEPSSVGYAMVFYSIATILGGILYGWMAKYTKHFTLLIAILFMAVGFVVFYTAERFAGACVALFICGIGGTMVVPASQGVYAHYVPKHRAFIASSVTMACINVGAFLSTPYLAIFETLGYDSTATIIPSTVLVVVLGLISVPFWKKAAAAKAV